MTESLVDDLQVFYRLFVQVSLQLFIWILVRRRPILRHVKKRSQLVRVEHANDR
jgi:hypothetical protein